MVADVMLAMTMGSSRWMTGTEVLRVAPRLLSEPRPGAEARGQVAVVARSASEPRQPAGEPQRHAWEPPRQALATHWQAHLAVVP